MLPDSHHRGMEDGIRHDQRKETVNAMMAKDYGQILCVNIQELRRQTSLTQEALADQLGITSQAVSKWENGISCPDITLLPMLAEIFQVSIDRLYGLPSVQTDTASSSSSLPWEDDGKIRAVVYLGTQLMTEPVEAGGKITFQYDGPARDVISYLSLVCGDVGGEISAHGSVECDDVNGGVDANGSVSCSDVGGNVSANGSVICADITGSVDTNGNVSCNTVEGNVILRGGTLHCDKSVKSEEPDGWRNAPAAEGLPWKDDGKIRAVVYRGTHLVSKPTEETASKITFQYDGPAKDVITDLSLICASVEGNVQAGNGITCNGEIGGSVIAGNGVSCGGAVGGDVHAGNSVRCETVCGSVKAGNNVHCADIAGNVQCAELECQCINGRAEVQHNVTVEGDIGGDVTAGNNVICSRIQGNASADGKIIYTVPGEQ